MVQDIIIKMEENTNSDGILIIQDHPVSPDDKGYVYRFRKCRMNGSFESFDDIEDICFDLDALGKYYYFRRADVRFGSYPEYVEDTDNDYLEEFYIDHARSAWKLFFDGVEDVGENSDERFAFAGKRLGTNNGKAAYDAFIRARQYCKSVAGSDDEEEALYYEEEILHYFVQSYVLAFCCTESSVVDLMNDRYDPEKETIGDFDRKDMYLVFDELCRSYSLPKEPCIGYTLLVNKIFTKVRLEICRRFESYKDDVDNLLATLTKTERKILDKKFGLTDGIRKSYDEIAIETDHYPEIIKFLEAKALRKLRHPFRLKKIKYIIES